MTYGGRSAVCTTSGKDNTWLFSFKFLRLPIFTFYLLLFSFYTLAQEQWHFMTYGGQSVPAPAAAAETILNFYFAFAFKSFTFYILLYCLHKNQHKNYEWHFMTYGGVQLVHHQQQRRRQ